MNEIKQFTVNVAGLDENGTDRIEVSHADETFSFRYDGKEVALINDGDNSWSIITGELSQETANIIGQAIEDYYQQQGY